MICIGKELQGVNSQCLLVWGERERGERERGERERGRERERERLIDDREMVLGCTYIRTCSNLYPPSRYQRGYDLERKRRGY